MGKKQDKNTYKRSSAILLDIAQDKNLETYLTYGNIVRALGERSFGIAMLFFSLPSALPFAIIPGVSFVFGIPIAIFAVQMIFARESLWLPKIIADKPISYESISRTIYFAVPYLVKLERLLKPRWGWMTCRDMEIVNGMVIIFLSFLLMLPIPLSNFIISSIVIIFSLGIIEKDGIFIFVAYVFSIFYIIFMSLLVLIGYKILLFIA